MSKSTIHTARSLFYIIIISGLLSLTSFVILLIWNNSIAKEFELVEISFLEAVGIVAFVYVIYFGIHFGKGKCQDDAVEDNLSVENKESDKMSYVNEIQALDLLKNVPESERKNLKDFIARCCGFRDLPVIKQKTIHTTISTEEKHF